MDRKEELEEASKIMVLIMKALKDFALSGQGQILHFGDAKITIEKEDQ